MNSCFCSEADIIEVGNVASSDKYLDGVNLFASSFGFSPLIEIKESLRKYLNTNWNYIADNHAKWEKELSEKEKLVAEAEKRELTLKDLSTSWQNMEKYNKGMEDLLNQYSDEITGMKNSSSFSAEKLSQLIEELFGDLSDFLKPLGFTLVLTEINDLKNKLKARILLPDRHPAQFPLLEGNEDVAYREEKNKELLIQLDNYLHRLSFMYFFQQMITQLEEVAVSQSRLKEEIKQLKDDILRYQLFLGAEHYLATLDKELQSVMSGLRGDIQPFVEKIMELFTGGAKNTEKIKIDENWKISVFYEENLGNVEKPVTVEISPMKFYNTFRYKLFCMMLRISTAVCMMKTHRFLFPIILDDLFYASDFYNRRLIKQFIESFVSISEQILGKNHLQLICFTHDEIVFTAIYEAVRGKRKIGSFLFGRLHDYRSVEKNEKGKYQLYVPLCLDNSKKGRGE